MPTDKINWHESTIRGMPFMNVGLRKRYCFISVTSPSLDRPHFHLPKDALSHSFKNDVKKNSSPYTNT
jgi:hypothetical protein